MQYAIMICLQMRCWRLAKKLIPLVGFSSQASIPDNADTSIDDSKQASNNASTPDSNLEVLSDKKQDSESSFLLTKQKRIKQEQLSVRINELVWEWLDKTYRASGRGKNELVERALIRLLPEKLMPKELRSVLPPDYFDKLK